MESFRNPASIFRFVVLRDSPDSQRTCDQFHERFRAAFMLVYPKSAKITVKSLIILRFLGSTFVKAARKMLMKLTPGEEEPGMTFLT
jgi:hypothetical protein